MAQAHRNKVFHDFCNEEYRNLVCTGECVLGDIIYMYIEVPRTLAKLAICYYCTLH